MFFIDYSPKPKYWRLYPGKPHNYQFNLINMDESEQKCQK